MQAILMAHTYHEVNAKKAIELIKTRYFQILSELHHSLEKRIK